MKRLIFISLLSITIIAENDILSKKSLEKSLLMELMKRYEAFGVSGRPVNDSKRTIQVYYGLALIQILGLDANTQILRTNCWSRYKWFDELLTWNTKDHGGINQIRLNRNLMWMPDIQLFNFADERTKVEREARVVVYNDGKIIWIPQALFKSSCSVEISYFPFDVQICRLDFGSWIYDITQLELHWWTIDDTGYPNDSMPYVDFKDYIVHNEWITDGQFDRNISHTQRLKQIKSLRFLREQNFTDGNKTVTKYFHVLRYRIRMRRNPSFYVFILIIPCVLLSLLVNIVFWLPPESPAKLLLGVNIFVAFFILLLLLKSSIPTAVKKFPLIGSFFCLNMCMITISSFLVTVVINFYVKGDKKGPMPNCIRKIMIDGVGRILFVSQFIPLPPKINTNQSVFVTQSPGGRMHHKLHVPELANNKFMLNDAPPIESASGSNYQNHPNIRNIRNIIPVEIPGDKNENQSNFRDNWCRFRAYSRHNSGVNVQSEGLCDPQDSPLMVCGSTSSIEKNVTQIASYVRKHIDKQKEIQRKNQLTMEWRTLGLVLDRLFWILYICTIIISVIIGIPTKKDLLKMEEEPVDRNYIFS